MESKKILMPNGEVRTYYRGDGDTWDRIIREVILPHWIRYCDSNWISPNHEALYAPEKRVKWFLDRLGWLLIEGAEGIESEYKNMSHTVREIPVTECPAEVSDYLYSDRHVSPPGEEDTHYEKVLENLENMDKRKRKKIASQRPKTQFERMCDIDRAHPDAKKTWCAVDADNSFIYEGRKYTIPSRMTIYREDAGADRVLAVEDERRLVFYDQSATNMFIVA